MPKQGLGKKGVSLKDLMAQGVAKTDLQAAHAPSATRTSTQRRTPKTSRKHPGLRRLRKRRQRDTVGSKYGIAKAVTLVRQQSAKKGAPRSHGSPPFQMAQEIRINYLNRVNAVDAPSATCAIHGSQCDQDNDRLPHQEQSRGQAKNWQVRR